MKGADVSGSGSGGAIPSGASGAAKTGEWNQYSTKSNRVGTARFPGSRGGYKRSGGGRSSGRNAGR